jgi:hypothetical protein
MIQYMSILKAYTDSSMELSSNEQLLFWRLFLVNNKAGWIEWFGATNQRLQLECGFGSNRTVINCRNSLKQKGFIDFVQGKDKQPTKYKLTIGTAQESARQTALENKGTAHQSAHQSARIIGTNVPIDNDYDNDIKKGAKPPKKKAPPKTEYAEAVFMTNAEHSALVEKLGSEQAVAWCIDKLNNYKLSSGKKYKNDYRAILSWVINEYQKAGENNGQGFGKAAGKRQRKYDPEYERDKWAGETSGWK